MDELGNYESSKLNDALTDLMGAGTSPINIRATVTRKDASGVSWAMVNGKEFPLQGTTVQAQPGEFINVSYDGISAYSSGNYTDPAMGAAATNNAIGAALSPVMIMVHKSQGEAEKANKIAGEAAAVAAATSQHFFADDNGAHITDVTQDEWNDAVADNFSDYDPTTKPYHNQLLNSLGILLRTALNNLVSITRSAIAFYDGQGNTASNIVARFGSDGAQIGKSGAAHSVIDANGQRFYATNGTTQLANIGYGEGANDTGGTSLAPYFSFGYRPPIHTFVVGGLLVFNRGDICSYNGSHYVCLDGTDESAWDASKWRVLRSTNAIGNNSVSEGYASSRGWESYAQGNRCVADGELSHAEGQGTLALGGKAHAEGSYTAAFGISSHAEGADTVASGLASHAQNKGTIAASTNQTAIGKHNVEDSNDTYALIIGNGTADNARSNALAVTWDGDIDTAKDTAWITLNSTIKYRVHHGVCYVCGDSVSGGTSVGTSGTNVGTLPAGARPSVTVTGAASTKSNAANGQFSIDSSGVIKVWNLSTSSPYWCFAASYPVG